MADIEKNSGNGVHDAVYHPFFGLYLHPPKKYDLRSQSLGIYSFPIHEKGLNCVEPPGLHSIYFLYILASYYWGKV